MPDTVPRLSARPRAGQRFEPIQEQQLVAVALQAISELQGDPRDRLVLTEMQTPYGVPDFVVAEIKRERLAARVAAGIEPILRESDAAIIAALSPTRGKSTRRVANELGWPEPSVHRRLNSLLIHGSVIKAGPTTYSRVGGLATVGSLTAVEMKVADWKRGLRQCQRYKVWADRYVLVLDKVPGPKLVDLLNGVRSDRGGLHVDGRWIRKPTGRQRDRAKRLWASEYLMAALGHQPSVLP